MRVAVLVLQLVWFDLIRLNFNFVAVNQSDLMFSRGYHLIQEGQTYLNIYKALEVM